MMLTLLSGVVCLSSLEGEEGLSGSGEVSGGLVGVGVGVLSGLGVGVGVESGWAACSSTISATCPSRIRIRHPAREQIRMTASSAAENRFIMRISCDPHLEKYFLTVRNALSSRCVSCDSCASVSA